MVWAMILQPHKIYELQVKNTFRLTMANLDTTLADDKPVQIMFISEETKYLLCTLHKNNVWQVPLNLIIEKGANISFVCHGGSNVHLLGHLKKYEILKEPEQDCRGYIAELLHDKMDELKSCRNRLILNNKEIEYLEVDESVNRNRKRQQLDTAIPSTSKDQEDKNQPKRKANPLRDALREIKRMKSAFKSKENYDNEYDKDCEDMKSCNDSDDDSDDDNDDNNDNDDDTDIDNDNKTIESENEDSNETEMEQEEKFIKSYKQEKKGKQQRNQDKQTKEEIKREQKDKKKKKEQGNNEGIRVIQGGVQVQELKAGIGKIAEPGKFVTIYYLARVQREDYESKVDKVLKGIGFRFKLGTGVTLRGVDVGIVGMKVGEKRRLIIPYKMGYGSAGRGPKIPPYSTLIYDVELIKVE